MKSDRQVEAILFEYDSTEGKRKKLMELSKKYFGREKELCEKAKLDIQKVVDENMHIGEMLVKIVENKYDFRSDDSRKFWARSLCECATELEDIRGLYAVVTEPELLPAHTAVRKAFRIIDFVNYGPQVE